MTSATAVHIECADDGVESGKSYLHERVSSGDR